MEFKLCQEKCTLLKTSTIKFTWVSLSQFISIVNDYYLMNHMCISDWADTDNSPFVDVPPPCTDCSIYKASSAHKANHSFDPNCKYVAIDHPRFGRIPGLKTIREVKKGEELYSHYKYDMALAPTWYQEAWEHFNHDSRTDSEKQT